VVSSVMGPPRISLLSFEMGVWGYSMLAVLFICLTGVIWLKLLSFFYANGIYYASWLRHAYTFTREVL